MKIIANKGKITIDGEHNKLISPNSPAITLVGKLLDVTIKNFTLCFEEDGVYKEYPEPLQSPKERPVRRIDRKK